MDRLSELNRGLHELARGLESRGHGQLILLAEAHSPDEHRLVQALQDRRREFESQNGQWDVPEAVAERWFNSDGRTDGGRLARAALLQALQRALSQGPDRLGASLSHGAGIGLAGVRISRHSEASTRIGVDVEAAGRVVSARVISRFASPMDETPELETIALWTLKEAVFKLGTASHTPFREIAVRLEVGSGRVWLGSAEWDQGRAHVGLLKESGVYVAAACGI